MLLRAFFTTITILFFIPQILGQLPQIARFVEVAYTETASYDSNVQQAEEAVDDFSFRHNLFLSHQRQKRFFNYGLSSNIGYENFLIDQDNDNLFYNLSGSLTHVGKNYQLGTFASYSLANQSSGLEVEPFTESIQQNLSLFGSYNLTEDLTLGLNVSHRISEIDGQNSSETIDYTGNIRYRYSVLSNLALLISANYTIVRDLEDDGDNNRDDEISDISIGFDFTNIFGLGDLISVSANNRIGVIDDNNNNVNDGNASSRTNINLLSLLPETDFPIQASIDSLTLTVGLSDEAFDGAPIIFSLSAAGLLGPRTVWNASANRGISFGVNDEDRIVTTFQLTVTHRPGSRLSVNLQSSYDLQELDDGNDNDLSRLTQSLSFDYPIFGKSNLSLTYTYTNGLKGREFESHRISLALTIPLY